MKRCTKCDREKPLGEFYLTRAGRPEGSCKACKKGYIGGWQRANRARMARYARQRRARNTLGVEAERARNRAYKRANRERATARERMRKAAKLTATVEYVDPLAVLELDDGACGVCGRDVDPANFHVDHVIPLARGGEHSLANTQTAHPTCNQRKYDHAP